MRWLSPVFALVSLLAVHVAHTQTAPTQQELETRLKSQFLMLRGMWDGPSLAFDSQGNLIGTAETLPFSLSAVNVTKTRLTPSELKIEAHRAGLEFLHPIRAVSWKSAGKVRITIALDSQHPEALDAAIASVFSIGIDRDLAASAPDCWQTWLRPLFGLPGRETPPDIYRTRGDVIPPRLSYAPNPRFAQPARELKYRGMVLIGLIVDADGRPSHVYIARPVGMGLDEEAVETVRHYQFAPATLEGKPVPFAVKIEVNFRIY